MTEIQHRHCNHGHKGDNAASNHRKTNEIEDRRKVAAMNCEIQKSIQVVLQVQRDDY